MLLAELFEKNEIGAQAYDVCKKARILNIDNLMSHLNYFKQIAAVHNCDVATEHELMKLALKYGIIIPTMGYVRHTDSKRKTKDSVLTLMTYEQIKDFNKLISEESKKISARAKSVLESMVGINLTLPILLEEVFDNRGFDFKHVRNAGSKTIEELEQFFNTIKVQLEQIEKSGRYL